MSIRTVTIILPHTSVTPQPVTLAVGAAIAGIKFSVKGQTEPAPQVIAGPAPYRATFAGLTEGSYVATYQAVDTLGNALGAPMTQPFTVSADAATVDIPTGLATISVA